MNVNNQTTSKKYFQVFLLAGGLTIASLIAAGELAAASVSHKSTNVTVTSSDLEPFSLNEKTESKEKGPVFYSDQNSSVDINENGEPNLNMRF